MRSQNLPMQEQLNDIQTGKANLYKFVVKTGKRYYKIVQQEFETWEKIKYYGQYRDGSVHAFVDKETGEVYKPDLVGQNHLNTLDLT